MSFNMLNGRGKLGDVVELFRLPRRVTIEVSVESIRQWFVICEDMKVLTLQEMMEMLDCQVDCYQLPVEGTVTCLSGT